MKAAIIGGGVIGGGWAARFLLNGWDVAVVDRDPAAERKLGTVLANARRSMPALYDRLLPAEGKLSFESDLEAAVADAEWVQESVPEQLAIKHELLGRLSELAPSTAIIGSSTSGFKPSELNAQGARAIVAHPFNPVYLLPLVELVGEQARTERAAVLLRAIGMFPLTLAREIDAHIADRLLEAVWREALWLIHDGIATTGEVDQAITQGFGLRWAQMGLFETYRLAGGEAGMAHFLHQFGPALQWPWTKLTDVPELTQKLIQTIVAQSDAQSGHHSIAELERQRDDNLVAMLRALKAMRSGAGETVRAHEANLPPARATTPPVTVQRQIPADWTDYNGHMNEARYLEAAGQGTDRFMELIGADQAYVAAGGSYFTVETHIRYLAELKAAERLTVTTQLLSGKGRKLHLFHRIQGAQGQLAATVETLLLHVDLTTRRTSDPSPEVAAKLASFAAAHASLDTPEAAGRHVGERRAGGT